MATISGSLRFDRDRTSFSSAAFPGIANIPIVLQNTATNEMLAVYTQANGNYEFTNVPDGNYRIVEAYGMSAVASPGDFSAAVPGAPVTAAFPPLSVIDNPPAGATNLDATTPTTRLVTVAGADLIYQDFLNGPVRYTPIEQIMDNNVTVFPANLITNAANGSFGTFPQGTAANTGAGPTPPYPEINSQFTYATPNASIVVPLDGEYTVQNLMTDALPQSGNNTWWRVADHTTGNETGRMMPVNGATPGAVFFEQQVTVKPLTYYLFSTWILNLSKSINITEPKLGVQVLAQDGSVLFNATLGEQIPMDPNSPEWRQIGTLIDTKNNSAITVRFTSEGPAEMGNDYVIDDIALQEIKVAVYNPQKTASPTAVSVGGTTTYTVSLTNTGKLPLTQASVKDTVPEGFSFVPGTVTVNGAANPTADPNAGFTVPDIAGGTTLTVTFQAVANQVPAVNPASNTAGISYLYTPVEGGIANRFDITTNPALVTVNQPASADLAVTKSSDKTAVIIGDVLTYTLNVTNHGPNDALSVTLTDAVSADLTGVEYSADGGVTWQSWHGTLPLGTVSSGAASSVLIRGTVAPTAGSLISNTASVESPTPDPNPVNNSSTVNTPTAVPPADLQITKTTGQTAVLSGEVLTYTLNVTNNGPGTAAAVTLADPIPTDLTGAQYSTDGGVTWENWGGTLPLGAIASGTARSIQIRGTVSPTANSIIVNTATVESPTPDPNPGNNSSVVNTPVTPPAAPSADLTVVKTGGQNPVLAGDLLTYTVNVTNNGPNDAQTVTLTDSVPADLTAPEYSADGGVIWLPWTGTLSLGTIAGGSAVSLRIRGTVSPAADSVIVNTARAESPTPDPNPGNNSSTVNTAVTTPAADLAVSKTAAQAAVLNGELLTYTINVTNNGPNDARTVTLTDAIPAELTAPEYSTDGGVVWQPWNGTLALGTVARAAAVTLMIRGTVSPTAAGIIANTAAVESPTPDPIPGNNSAVVNIPITPAVPNPQSADLAVTKTAAQTTVTNGELLTYTLAVANNGPDDARTVTLTDAVSADLTGVQYSTDNGATWSSWTGTLALGTVTNGRTLNIQIRGTVSPTADSVIINTATVESPTPDPNPANNSSLVNTPLTAPAADLTLTKLAGQTAVKSGDTLTYTINVTNNGPDDARSVTLTDTLPADLTGGEYSTDNGITWLPWSGTFSLGTVANGTTRSILIRGLVSATANSVIVNTAAVESPTPDPRPGNNSSLVNIPVTPPLPPAADLAVIKTATPTAVKNGEVLNYILTVTNNGPDAAPTVTLTDHIAADLTGAQYSTDGGVTWQHWNGTLPLGTMSGGAAVTILIRGTVSPTADSVIVNTAEVESPTPDPNPRNNSSLVNTPLIPPAADLAVTKTAGAAAVSNGGTLTYTVSVTNNGPDAAQSVLLTDAVSADLRSVEYSADAGRTWAPWGGTLPLGTMNGGTTQTIHIRGTVSPTAGSLIVNTAAAESPTPDPRPGNNTSTVNIPITPPAPPAADLEVFKTSGQNTVKNGQLMSYTINITNRGPAAAQTVTLFDPLSPQLTQAEYSRDGLNWQPWNGSCPLGTIAGGTNVAIYIRGTVSPSATGVITNAASAESPTPDPRPDNNVSVIRTPITPPITPPTPIIPPTGITIEKTVYPRIISPGTAATYTLTVTNQGPCEAANLLVTDCLPKEIVNAVYSLDNGKTWFVWPGSIKLEPLAPCSRITVLLKGFLNNCAAGKITNCARVSAADCTLSRSKATIRVRQGLCGG